MEEADVDRVLHAPQQMTMEGSTRCSMHEKLYLVTLDIWNAVKREFTVRVHFILQAFQSLQC